MVENMTDFVVALHEAGPELFMHEAGLEILIVTHVRNMVYMGK